MQRFDDLDNLPRQRLLTFLSEVRNETEAFTEVFNCMQGFGESLTALQRVSGQLCSLIQVVDKDEVELFSKAAQILATLSVTLNAVAICSDSIKEQASQIEDLKADIARLHEILPIGKGLAQQYKFIRSIALQAGLSNAPAEDSGPEPAGAQTEKTTSSFGFLGIGEVVQYADEISSQIEGTIKFVRALLENAADIDAGVGLEANALEGICDELSAIHIEFNEVLGGLSEIEGQLATCRILSEIESATLQDLSLKFAVYQVFMGLSQLTAVDIPDASCSALGRWAKTCDGTKYMRCQKEFAHFLERLEKFHEYAGIAITTYHQGDMTKACSMLRDMENAHLSVLHSLHALIVGREKHIAGSHSLPSSAIHPVPPNRNF